MSENQEELFVNPIDSDKVAAHPHLLPYAHTVGGAVIKPIDKGRVKGLAVSAMYEQTDMQLEQIRQQMELLAHQAKAIQNRVRISEAIYSADVNFEPVITKTYHLYRRRTNQQYVLSLVAPEEWGPNPPYDFIASVRLLGDHTWDVLQQAEGESI